MDDLISRQAAIDVVKDAVIKDEQQYAEDALKALPPVRFTTLSDDEIETIRIHLSAIKEELCNQSRYGEAEYYEKLIAKFLSSNIIHCKDCLYKKICSWKREGATFCSFGERGDSE